MQVAIMEEPVYAVLLFSVIFGILLYCYVVPVSTSSVLRNHVKSRAPSNPKRKPRLDADSLDRMQLFKDMYHKVQNLEDFPEVLPAAEQLLLSLLRQGLLVERYKSQTRSILDLEEYDRVSLGNFLEDKRQEVLGDFEAYVRRREAGSGPELFRSREEAAQWLRRSAPLNYIDGAWLARIHKITTPFAYRSVTGSAWQTLSEELGDGDLEKNHIFLFRDMLQDVGVVLPDGDTPDFIHPRHGMNDEQVWRAATGQLLVSLFPNDFLPEILGFNLHYESVASTIFKATKELPEFGISAYYYALHISIDNADSGHSAMALDAVVRFMDTMREAGPADYHSAWKRIRAGYVLSQNLENKGWIYVWEEKVADMLRRKAKMAHKIHCHSQARIGRRSVSDWLSSDWPSDDGQDDNGCDEGFLVALADSKPWVYRGDSGKSRLMRELSWNGRMFGAFTHSEVEMVRTWIDSLDEDGIHAGKAYWQMVGVCENVRKTAAAARQDVATGHPVVPPWREWCPSETGDFVPWTPLHFPQVRLHALLTLWFVHPCLLENTVSTPHQAATGLASKVLRLLRAELGYGPENTGIAGMDEQRRLEYNPDLVSLGLEIMRKHGLPEPACLGDVLGLQDERTGADAHEMAYTLLGWAMRPKANCMFLLGLARAFLDLEVWVANNDMLLGKRDREALRRIVNRKSTVFEACWRELEADDVKRREFVGGYEWGRKGIEQVLG